MDQSYSLTQDALKQLKRAQKTLDQVQKKIHHYKLNQINTQNHHHNKSYKQLSIIQSQQELQRKQSGYVKHKNNNINHNISLNTNHQGIQNFKTFLQSQSKNNNHTLNNQSSAYHNNKNQLTSNKKSVQFLNNRQTDRDTYDNFANSNNKKYDLYQQTADLLKNSQNNQKNSYLDLSFANGNIQKIEKLYQQKNSQLDKRILQLQSLVDKVNKDKKLLSMENDQLQRKIRTLQISQQENSNDNKRQNLKQNIYDGNNSNNYNNKSSVSKEKSKQRSKNNINITESDKNVKITMLKQEIAYIERQYQKIGMQNKKIKIKNKRMQSDLKVGIQNYRQLLRNDINSYSNGNNNRCVKCKSLMSKRCPYH